MVSDTTLIFMPANGLAASWNHFSSVVCCSSLSVLGLNSGSHFLTAALRSVGGGAEPADPLPAEPLPAEPLPPPSVDGFLPHPLATSSAPAAAAVNHHHAGRHCLLENGVLVCMGSSLSEAVH